MVAPNKRPSRRTPQSIVSLWLEARNDHDQLLAEAQQLRAAGRHREARVLLKTAQFVEVHLAALDDARGRGAATDNR
jgi:hypothetical protein